MSELSASKIATVLFGRRSNRCAKSQPYRIPVAARSGRGNDFIIVCSICVCVFSVAANGDDLDDFIKRKPSTELPWLDQAQQLIRTHPDDPRILWVRLRYIGQTIGASRDPGHFRAIINQLDELIHDAGSKDSAVSFRAAMRKGMVFHDCLADYRAAHDVYVGLLNHPYLDGSGLEIDYDRTSLYLKLASTALSIRNLSEAEKYAQLVMAYPYLGMEDRAAYERFCDLYERAGNIYISAVSDDLKKLTALEIYPSHPRLFITRQRMISSYLTLHDLAPTAGNEAGPNTN